MAESFCMLIVLAIAGAAFCLGDIHGTNRVGKIADEIINGDQERIRLLEEAAEPVIHSYWEVAIGYDPNKKVQCQNCFMMAYEPTMRCPHCGAHMDEEVANGKID